MTSLYWDAPLVLCWSCRGELHQYDGCWCPGSLHHQGISSHGIDYVSSMNPCLPWGRISPTCAISISRKNKNASTFISLLEKKQHVKLFSHMISMRSMLILNVRGPSYLGLTRSVSWLLMPWLLTSPGHQQPWYWLYKMCRSFSYLRKDFKYLCHINVEEWHKIWIYVFVPCEKFSM